MVIGDGYSLWGRDLGVGLRVEMLSALCVELRTSGGTGPPNQRGPEPPKEREGSPFSDGRGFW